MMTYGRMLFGVLLASASLASAVMGYGYEVMPKVSMLSGESALLLGGVSFGCIVLFIVAYHVDKRN